MSAFDYLKAHEPYNETFLRSLNASFAKNDSGKRAYMYDNTRVYLFLRETGYSRMYYLEEIKE